MTTVTRPRGPLPARVYWTRRMLVLVVALALVFAVAQLLGRGGGSSGGPSARPVGADTTSSAPASTADAKPSRKPSQNKAKRGKVSATPTPKPTPTPTPLAIPSGYCAQSDIVATPTVKDVAYAGKAVVFTLALTTKVSPACTWEVSSSSLVVRLTSGDDRIWSTQDCPLVVPKRSVVVRKDHPATIGVAWNGQRSDSGCTRSTPWALPGFYFVTAAALGGEPTEEQFELELPPRPTITPSPKPSTKSSAKPSGRQT